MRKFGQLIKRNSAYFTSIGHGQNLLTFSQNLLIFRENLLAKQVGTAYNYHNLFLVLNYYVPKYVIFLQFSLKLTSNGIRFPMTQISPNIS